MPNINTHRDVYGRGSEYRESYSGIAAKFVTPEPSPEHVEAVRAWFKVWRGLTPEKQAAWQQLPKAQREASKRMTAGEFAEFMGTV